MTERPILTEAQANELTEAISILDVDHWPVLVDALNARHPEWAWTHGIEGEGGLSWWIEVKPAEAKT